MKTMPKPEIKSMEVNKLTKASTSVRTEYPEKALEVLKTSILHIGLLNPPIATSKGEVFVGWARVVACREIGIPFIPVFIARGWSVEDQIIASLVENYHKANYTEDEVRPAIRRLIDEQVMSLSAVASMIGMERKAVESLLSSNPSKDITKKNLEQESQLPEYSMENITEVIQTPPARKKRSKPISKEKLGN